MGYAPIDFIKSGEGKDGNLKSVIDTLVKAGVESFKNITEDEYIDTFLDFKFMNPNAKWKHEDLTQLLILNSPDLLESMGSSINDVYNNEFDVKTEWKDIYLGTAIWERWSRNKQVFQPDPYFTEALLHTDGLELTKEQITHLPVDTFYIDFTDVPLFDPIVGAVVYVRIKDTQVDVVEYLLSKDLLYYSFYTGGRLDENGMIKLNMNNFVGKPYLEYDTTFNGNHNKKVIESVIDRTQVSLFGVQMISYLTSREPDITENPITKSTYKKTSTVKNKFSEVQKWDVGVRFGKSIQSRLTEAQNESRKSNSRSGNHNGSRVRKSPVPHFRCAHWHKYWVGQGRKKCEVRWVEPTLVGFNIPGVDSAANVVIHKVK